MTEPNWTPEQRRRIDELVLAAAGLDPDEREDVLATADQDKGTSQQVLAEVRRRLALADAAGDGFLESPLSAFLHSEGDREARPGEDVDSEVFAELAASERFEMGNLLGRGGMAEVYDAFDRRLDRDVALKLLHPSDVATEQRFLHEARAQARIRHEHVLAIYDVGRLGERPFLAMERVNGGTLSELAPKLPLEEKVRLVAQAAQGLHAAHRRGLIHRDVKPSNVLVGRTDTGERRAWVTDFGIAVVSGLVDRESGSMLFGTPHYMAPERINRGDAAVDRRSDVWSLGVTLYQLLAGRTPFDGETPLRVLRAVTTGTPPSLRVSGSGVPDDLAAIVDKCLRRDPEERYPSARAVADDLRRFLDGEVVEAHTAGIAYRLARFAQKHRASLAVAGVLAAGLLVALIVAAVLGLQAVRAQRGLEQRQQQAESLVTFMLGDLRERLEPLGRLDVLDSVGDEAMAYFAKVPESELTDDELAHRAKALYQIGSVRQLQGDLPGAKVAFDESLHLAESLWQRDPTDYDRLFGLAQSQFWVGFALWEGGDRDDAGLHFERYLELSRRLVELAPETRDAWMELYYAHSNLGSWEQDRGELEAALDRFDEAHNVLTSGPTAADPDDPDWLFEVAAAQNSLGLVKRQLGRVDEASAHFETELEMRRRLVRADPQNREWTEYLATALQYTSSFDRLRENHQLSAERLSEANGLLDELVTFDPTQGVWRYKRAWARSSAARAALALGHEDDALRQARDAIADAQELAELDPSQISWRRVLDVARVDLGRSLLRTERVEDAEKEAATALASLTELATEHPEDRLTHLWLAQAQLLSAEIADRTGNDALARVFRQQARHTLEPWVEGSRDPSLLRLWLEITRWLDDQEAASDAAARLRSLGFPTSRAVTRR